jgi:hypothetical protein
MEDRLLPERMINRRDLGILRLTDDVDEVVRIIERSYAKRKRAEGADLGDGRETP